jgi:hypothetical protein
MIPWATFPSRTIILSQKGKLRLASLSAAGQGD